MSNNPTELRVIVHDLAQAHAALAVAAEAGLPAVLLSAPDGAARWGAAGFAALAAAPAGGAVRWVLDCGDHPGHALAALACGLRHVRLRAEEAVLEQLTALGLRLEDDAPALDLLDRPHPQDACRAWLGLRKAALPGETS